MALDKRQRPEGSGTVSLSGERPTGGLGSSSISLSGQRPTGGLDGSSLSLSGERPTGGLDGSSVSLSGERPTGGLGSGSISLSGERPTGGLGSTSISLSGVRPTGGVIDGSAGAAGSGTPTGLTGQRPTGGRGPMTGQRPTGGVDCQAGDADHGRCDGTGFNRQAREDTAAWATWWVAAGVIGVLTMLYLFRVWRARVVKRRVLALRSSTATDEPKDAPAKLQVPTKKHHIVRATSTAFTNLAHVRVFPLWLYSNSTANEWFWTAAYTGIVLGLGMYGSQMPGEPVSPINFMGYIAYSQVPLIIGLANRNNLISLLTGISYEKLNYLHRAAGRVCVLTSSIHSIGWASKSAMSHAFAPGSYIFNTGMVAWAGLLLIYISSFRTVRAWMYEAFLALHIAMALMFIIGCLFHWVALWGYLAAGLIIWGGSRILGAARLVYLNSVTLFTKPATTDHLALVELLDAEVMRITVPTPMKWKAGQHAYLTMPSINKFQQHPFTVATASGDAVFFVRTQRGFTRRLRDRLIGTKSRTRCLIEGPYGNVHSMHHYDTVLLVVGGTGVSFATSLLLDTLAVAKKDESTVTALHMIWNVRSADNVAWIAPLLNQALEGNPAIRVRIDVFVTRGAVPALESDEEDKVAGPSTAVVEEKAGPFGLSAAATRAVNLHAGRSPLEHLLREDVLASAHDAAGVCVTVCGPTELALSARRAVMQVNTATAVLRGQVPVSFHAEAFGW